MNKVLMAIVAGMLLLSAVARADATDDTLAAYAAAVNKKAGLEQDGRVLRRAIYSKEARTFAMVWALPGVRDQDIPEARKQLKAQEMALIESLCSEPLTRKLINAGATLGHAYYTAAGAEIVGLGVGSESCEFFDAMNDMSKTK